ncbi:DsbA family protein [Jannaschia aquimarina]|uniref:BdbD_2 protein n=1 Tax=Jannaschia aquimarina TaxID=935700 RepID=A0A0D1EHN5_9RHOB|nr:DsbA family protein [Jannaschia aquimarina]KIT16381.1 Disulfide bond formation protein D precursor [Jannaschia aquimarina]SNT05228.1 Protein-disulfide isomerase [Jannaschia aquimarina]
MRQTLIAALLATAALPAAAQELTAEEVKRLALEAILENPEVVMEAIGILQEREAAEAAAQAQAALESSGDLLTADPNAPVLGNPDGDVTVVEFFDYNCPYCRRAGPEVAGLLEADGNVRVVYREWPILGEASVFAARAALASREQGLYEEFHEAMMAAEARLGEAQVMQIAEEVGLDTDRLRTDMEAPAVQAHIDTSMELARSLGFSGTPSFVVGDQMAPGLVETDQLIDMVEAAREGG